MRGLVLALEAMTEGHAFDGSYRAVRRKREPKNGHAIAAAAMLEFEMDDEGVCGGFALHGIDHRTAGELALVLALDRKLSALERVGGRLVTWNGQRDLAHIRLGALRHHRFTASGAAVWQRDLRDAHDDVMAMAPGIHISENLDLAELCEALGLKIFDRHPHEGPARHELIVAELHALKTMVVYLHLLAERKRRVDPLSRGIVALAQMISCKLRTSPHLLPILRTNVFDSFAPIEF